MPFSERGASGVRSGAFASAYPVTGELQRRPNSASKTFWAEAADTEVASIAMAMPVTSMPLTPRLKRVWRRINKPNGSPRRAPTIPQAHHLTISLASGQKYDLRVPGVRRSCGPAPVGLRRAYPGGEDFRKRPIVLGHLPRHRGLEIDDQFAAWCARRDGTAHSFRQQGRRYRLRRRAIDSGPFLSLVTGKASRFWSAPRTAGLSE